MVQVYICCVNLIIKYVVSVFGKKIVDQGIEFIDEKVFKGIVLVFFNEQLVKDIVEQVICICGVEVKEGIEVYVKILKLIEKVVDFVFLNCVQCVCG